ncbi:MAG: hypothetical protein U0821_04665 [Chloroflexota bacterium]
MARGSRALIRWQRAAGPLWSYVLAAPFIAPVPLPRSPRLREEAVPGLQQTVAEHIHGGVVIVDLDPVVGLRQAPEWTQAGAFVVPVIQRWPAHPAVLDSRALLRALVSPTVAPRKPSTPDGVVLVLDGPRAGRPGPPLHARLFDNRYQYPLCRFPPASLLASQSIGRATLVTDRSVAPDVLPYLGALANGGLAVSVVQIAA